MRSSPFHLQFSLHFSPKIVQKYSPYVSHLSRKFYVKDGTGDDLFEEGVIGILQACKNYRGESLFEEKFNSFVKICIRRQILDAIKKSNAYDKNLDVFMETFNN